MFLEAATTTQAFISQHGFGISQDTRTYGLCKTEAFPLVNFLGEWEIAQDEFTPYLRNTCPLRHVSGRDGIKSLKQASRI